MGSLDKITELPSLQILGGLRLGGTDVPFQLGRDQAADETTPGRAWERKKFANTVLGRQWEMGGLERSDATG